MACAMRSSRSQKPSIAQAILASLPDGAIYSDCDGVILKINPGLERIAGWSEPEVLGRHVDEVYKTFDSHGAPISKEERLGAIAIERREVVSSRGYGMTLETRDGRRVPIGVTAAPVLDAENKLWGAVAVVRDVSYEREVDQLKSSLVSTVSHELRTPLTMIQGFSELLLGREMSPGKTHDALEQINSAAHRLSRLIDDLLSVSRIESGRQMAAEDVIDIGDVVHEVIPPFADASSRRFVVDLEDGLPPARADRDKLVQILTNLVSNAVKYSFEETPVTVSARQVETALEISVTDRGIGLTDEEVAQLFGKFFRANRPEVREVGGTGLGLYIVKNLVEMQGGQMWVASKPGAGSSFTFTMPIASPENDPIDLSEMEGGRHLEDALDR